MFETKEAARNTRSCQKVAEQLVESSSQFCLLRLPLQGLSVKSDTFETKILIFFAESRRFFSGVRPKIHLTTIYSILQLRTLLVFIYFTISEVIQYYALVNLRADF